MPDIGIAIVDITKTNRHELLYANENYYLNRKYKPKELEKLCKNNVAELLDMESQIHMNIMLEETLKYRKEKIDFDIKVNCKDGECKCLLCKGKLKYEPERIIMNVVETDITDVCNYHKTGIL